MVAQLEFSNVKFCGRRDELQSLSRSLQQVSESKQAAIVFIEGPSGSGKSTLVNNFIQSNVKDGEVIYCQGKFEQGRAITEPLSGIEDALKALFVALNEKSAWRDNLTDELKVDLRLIFTAFAQLQGLLEDDDSSGTDKNSAVISFGSTENQWSFDRLRFAIRSLLGFLSEESTIVLFLDDLQWAGSGALAIVETLALDLKEGRQFLLIGSHRPVDSSHALSSMRSTVVAKVPKTEPIKLRSLTTSDTRELLKSLLRRDDEEVDKLVETVSRKTGGNAFFLITFLRVLVQKKLLFYSLQSYRWEWDSDRISSQTDISDNVVSIVADKIRTISEQQRECLTTAACLGVSHFDVNTLRCAMTPDAGDDTEAPGLVSPVDNTKDLVTALRGACDDGFLEELSDGEFKFAHDRVREGAYALLPEGQVRGKLHLSIGRRLRRTLSSSQEKSIGRDRLLLQTANQLNLGSQFIVDTDESLDIARLNYEAATLAVQRSSFAPASDFLRSGISLLGANPWERHSELMMNLSIALTRMEYCCGRQASSLRVADDVLSHADTYDDKRTVYHTKILCLTQQGDLDKALGVAFTAMKGLGCAPPRRFVEFHVLREMWRTRRMFRRLSDDDIMNLPYVSDQRINDISELLQRIGELALNGQNPNPALHFWVMIRAVQLVVEYGLFPMSPSCIVAWGIINAALGSFDEATRFGRLALRLAEQERSQHDLRAVLLYYYFVAHWHEPFHRAVEPSSIALKKLWDLGYVEVVLYDTTTYLRAYFCSGFRLEPLDRDSKKYVSLLKDYNHNIMLDNNIAYFQMVSNLMGDSDHTIKLTGDFMDQGRCLEEWTSTRNDQALQTTYFARLMLSCFFGEFALAWDMSREMWPPSPQGPEGPETFVLYKFFFQGLTAIALFKTSRKRIHWKTCSSAIRQLTNWLKQGVVNCHPLLLLLRAERKSVSKRVKVKNVQKAFDEAIATTGRLGILHIQALACERAAAYFLEQQDRSWATSYLERARELYHDWGAMGKVRHMERRYGDFLEVVKPSSHSKNLRAKQHLGALSTETHKALHY